MSTTTKPKGQDLLDFLKGHKVLNQAELCTGAGYTETKSDGSQGSNYQAFYAAILDARIANGEDIFSLNSDTYWYDSLTDVEKKLYDAIEDLCPEFCKLNASQCQQFMDKLSGLGIKDSDVFEEAYMYQTDSHDAQAECAQWYTEELCAHNIEDGVTYDWQATWETQLKDQFDLIKFGDETYFFSKAEEEH